MPDESSPQLRAALEEAARLRAQNTGLLRERDQTVAQLRSEAGGRIAAEEAALDSAISQAEEEKRNQQRELAELQAEGKFTEAAELVGKMTDTSARILSHRQQKENLAGRRDAVAREPAPQPVQDPLEGLNERERAWVGEHPAYLSDPAFRETAAAAANYATRVLKLDRNSDAYIEHVNRAMGGGASAEPASPAVRREPGEPAEPGEVRISASEPQEPAPVPVNSADGPAVRLEDEMVDAMYPQQRAVGKGGAGIRQVAAPPSRRISELFSQHTGGRDVTMTPEEVMTARTLVRDIAPEIAARGDDQEILQTYVIWNQSPSAQRKLKRWYGSV